MIDVLLVAVQVADILPAVKLLEANDALFLVALLPVVSVNGPQHNDSVVVVDEIMIMLVNEPAGHQHCLTLEQQAEGAQGAHHTVQEEMIHSRQLRCNR